MPRFGWLFLVLVCGGPLAAQVDIGVGFGIQQRSIRARPSEGHVYANFSDINSPDLGAALFYRERRGSHGNLGLELQWIRQEFHANYYAGGLAGGIDNDVRVVLHTLSLAILPEIRMAAGSDAVIRFGISGGFRVAGRMTGWRTVSVPYHYERELYSDAVPKDFGGELRFIVGFGFRAPAGSRGGITIDPYGAYGFSSMLKADPGSRSAELGIRIGWSLRLKGEGLSAWIDRMTAEMKPY